MAINTTLALAVRQVLGSRHALGLKMLLMALAIVGGLGAALVVAGFYPREWSLPFLSCL